MIIFEGEYLFDKKWNGNGYDANGNIIYHLRDGNGFVKEYDCYSNKLLFEGEYLNGKRNGKGKEYNYTGICFSILEGEYLNGESEWKVERI